jgi:hypothetical protein
MRAANAAAGIPKVSRMARDHPLLGRGGSAAARTAPKDASSCCRRKACNRLFMVLIGIFYLSLLLPIGTFIVNVLLLSGSIVV